MKPDLWSVVGTRDWRSLIDLRRFNRWQLAGLVLVSPLGACHEDRWVRVGDAETGEGSTAHLYIDTERIGRRSDGLVSGWLRYQNPSISLDSAEYTAERFAIDCSTLDHVLTGLVILPQDPESEELFKDRKTVTLGGRAVEALDFAQVRRVSPGEPEEMWLNEICGAFDP